MRASLLLESVPIESRFGDIASRSAALDALEQVDGELGDPAVHRAALLQRIEFAETAGDRAMHEQATRALRDCVPDDNAHWNAELHLADARMAFTLGLFDESYSAGTAALASSRVAEDEAAAARALCFLVQVETHRGNLSAADVLFNEAAEVAARTGDPLLEQLALSSGNILAFQRHDMERCIDLSDRSLDLAAKLGDRPAEAQAHGRLAVSLATAGMDAKQVRQHYEMAAGIYRENGYLAGNAGQLLNQALFELKLGFFDRARTATEHAVGLFKRANDERGRIGGLSNLTFLRAYAGQIAGAREAAELALARARELGLGLIEASVLENLAFAEGKAGEYARAIELAEASFEMRSRYESPLWSSTTLANFAIWNAALGNLEAARQAARRLLSDEDAIMRTTDWPSHCYWAAAQVFRRDGNAEEAARALERARRLMEENAGGLDPEDRESFLALPWHVDLMHAISTGVWPDPPR
jgi:tetratricopeptide (TPR) repeat protein